ncbi:MAG: hypothetical protein HY682_05060 [Chloroflexi bacterium]|nr:hypothetical protein [Chloroflexota bacterium]
MADRTPLESGQRERFRFRPGAFTVLKGLAFHGRGDPKHAYDLYHALKYLGVIETAGCLRPMRSEASAKEALRILERDFSSLDSVGPMRAAEILRGGADEEVQADVVAHVADLLEELK